MAACRGGEYGIPPHRRPSRRHYRVWNAARQRAKKSNIPFTLTREWVEERIDRGSCEVTGIEFSVLPGEGRGNPSPWAPSIDQITPGAGYTPENSRLVCWIYNCAKSTASDEDVLKLANALVSRGHPKTYG